MKKIAALVVALVCLAGFSLVSFAAGAAIPISSFSQLVEDKGSYLDVKQVIPASKFDSNALTAWNQFTSSLSGSSTYMPFIFVDSKTLPCTYGFLCFDSTKIVDARTNGYLSVFNTAPSFHYLTVSFDSSGAFTSYNIETIRNFLRYTGKTLLWGHGSFVFTDELNRKIDYASDLDYINRGSKLLQLTDDIGLPEEPDPDPEPPESVPDTPEPPESVPDTPKPPSYVPIEPGIPAGDGKYVLYDTGVWKTVINHIRGNMGAAANMGLLVFGFILIWSILRKIFHHFTKV